MEGLDAGCVENCVDVEGEREQFYLHYSRKSTPDPSAVISTRVILPAKQVGTVPWYVFVYFGFRGSIGYGTDT